MVGLTLMKVSSCSQSVSPPKTSTTTPVTSGITAIFFRISQLSSSESTMAPMNQAVATKMSARPFMMKKTTSGPSSSASLMACGFISSQLSSGSAFSVMRASIALQPM
ncbi:hypothetical protein D3C87_1750910 [compost metagenome]